MEQFGGLTMMTYEEAVSLGIECTCEPPSEVKTCNFCRKELPYKGFVIDGKITRWAVTGCRCWEARNYAREVNERDNRAQIIAGMREHAKSIASLHDDGISARYRMRTFDTFDVPTDLQQKAKTIAERYVASFERVKGMEKNSLFFFGDCGCGKTHLVCAIANALRDKGVKCVFTTFEDMLLKIRDSYSGDGASDMSIRNEYKKTPLLILDDLAKERATEFSTSVLFDLINYRYENMLPMIITANHDRDALIQRLTAQQGDATKAEAIVSRLYEMCVPISMMGIKDHRR